MRRRALVAGGIVAVAAGLVVAVTAGGGDSSPTTPAEDRGEVIARVDGIPIYSLDAKARVEGVQDVHTAVEAELPTDIKKTVFQSLVNDVIVEREAQHRDLEPTDAELEAEVERVAGMSGSEGLDPWLKAQGITRAELKRRIGLTIIWDRLKAAMVADVTVADDEVRAYYDEHPEGFQGSDGLTPYLEVKASIEDRLVDERQQEVFTGWLREQQDAVTVEILAEEWKDAR